ncbi:MAG: aminopeptidase [Gemmatimonadaceae bacterium]
MSAARRPVRRLGRALGGVILVIIGVAVVTAAATRTGRYLVRAAWEEGKILARRRPIATVLADTAVPPAVRAKLRLVLDARAFAADSVRLEVAESFTTYSPLDSDTLVVVVSAAARDELRQYGWWFPVVGRVPYKGFFEPEQALAEARRLDERGYDTYVRPASAFSTLGWFNDPVVSTTLRMDSLNLVDTVIHELLHNGFYAPGQAVFNESFANFVGARGATWFYGSRGDSAAVSELERRWHDERLLGAFWTRVYRSLDSAFAAHAGDDSVARGRRLAARDSVYAAMRVVLLTEIGPAFQSYDARALERTRFDNALLLARRIYLTDLDLFEGVYEREGRDLRRTIDRVTELAEDRPDEPYEALRGWLSR